MLSVSEPASAVARDVSVSCGSPTGVLVAHPPPSHPCTVAYWKLRKHYCTCMAHASVYLQLVQEFFCNSCKCFSVTRASVFLQLVQAFFRKSCRQTSGSPSGRARISDIVQWRFRNFLYIQRTTWKKLNSLQ